MNYASGLNNEGDFDQLSLAGVDFGEDYCEDYGIEPANLEGEVMYSGIYDQMGMDYSQLGVVPEGLGADFDQMGIIPSGLGGQYQQLGHSYNQMGSYYDQMGFMTQWNALSSTHKMIAGGVAAIALALVAKKMGYIKSLPFIG